jgi:thermostable 8-oxoguanine DNA glycosylase
MPAEVGQAAFYAVRNAGLLLKPASNTDYAQILSKPLCVNGRPTRYRFWRQRSNYLASALKKLSELNLDSKCHVKFRDQLTQLDGIGLKTASWITRNWLDSDRVAVLDVHILRAGHIVGLYEPNATPSKQYHELEDRFIEFANAISVRTSRLDALIWRQMKASGDIGIRICNQTLHSYSR